MLIDLPGAKSVADCHLTHLTHLLRENSHGRLGREKAIEIRNLAKESIGAAGAALSLELRQTIEMLIDIRERIAKIDSEIKCVVLQVLPPFFAIKGIGYTLCAIIIAEIGDIHRFDDPNKLQAYAGLEPSTYQSGNFTSSRDAMVKRGSAYLRWALLIAARLVAKYDRTFGEVLERKLAEGKHYNVAVSHVAKKLIRVIYHLMITGEQYAQQV
jgi:transposase